MSARKRPAKFLVVAGLVVVIAVGGLCSLPGSPVTSALAGQPQPEAGLPLDLTAPSDKDPASTPSLIPTGVTMITRDIADATIGRYGTRTRKTFVVAAEGLKLRYTWQHQAPSGGAWQTLKGKKTSRYTAKASVWASGTRFRVIVAGTRGKAYSTAAMLTVLFPSRTPAADASTAFGLTGLSQGVDISAYQHTPSATVSLNAIAAWAGPSGFAMLRNGSGARPIKQKYTSVCTDKPGKTGTKPAVEDCAYQRFADAAQASGLRLGHYWFNGWITSIDTTKKNLFSGAYTPTSSAKQFVSWLTTDGNYTTQSTDPLVLDIEAGHAWSRTYKGKSYTRTLRAWNPTEATEFLTTVRQLLTSQGYQANLYVYMSANATARQSEGTYVWTPLAPLARLWVASWGTNNGRLPDALPQVGPWLDYGGWSIWQYTSNANLPRDGVGAIDGDIAMPDAWTPR
ncbi:MAG: GH25 family lysozyme [Propionicimonas sp.]